jgi:hypothetical protein
MPSAAFTHSPLTIAQLRNIAQFFVQQDPSDGDWYRVRSTALPDKYLFAMLEAVWPVIVGHEPHKFALIHCLGGPSAGVWLHLLPNADYQSGCFEVPSL